MLGNWISHAEYQKKLWDTILPLFRNNPNSMLHFEAAFAKMFFFNMDCIREDFLPLFSCTGRPSNQQPQLFRSLLLMVHFGYSSIKEWVIFAISNQFLCALVGVTPSSFPGISTHNDFITRLWQKKPSPKQKRVKKKPSKKLGKEKMPPKHPGIVSYLVEKALSGQTFDHLPERLFQVLFMKTALLPSISLGLLGDPNHLTVAADGTCILSHASSYGKKTCSCKGICSCKRSFADPDAKWGWDSYHEMYFYGYTAYLLSVYNKELKLDLPIYIKCVEASRNDSATFVTALAHAKHLYRDFLSFDNVLADAIHDNYPTYDLLRQWDIKPFIPLKDPTNVSLQSEEITFNNKGIPICADGYEMVNWGFEKKKYRIKYRCPYVLGKVKQCPYAENCNNSPYGKIVYVRLAENLRILTPVPRGTKEWSESYKQRTTAERVNNRILTDYKLEQPKRYGKKKLAFFAFCNAIHVHLDAQIRSPNARIPQITSFA